MPLKLDKRPTKRRDWIVFGVMLIVVLIVCRDQLLFLIKDGGYLMAFDSAYDEFIIADEKVRPLATGIVRICNESKTCPLTPDGWDVRQGGREAVLGEIVYVAVKSKLTKDTKDTPPYDAFRMTYDYDRDWRLVASGGVGTDVVAERQKR